MTSALFLFEKLLDIDYSCSPRNTLASAHFSMASALCIWGKCHIKPQPQASETHLSTIRESCPFWIIHLLNRFTSDLPYRVPQGRVFGRSPRFCPRSNNLEQHSPLSDVVPTQTRALQFDNYQIVQNVK